MGQQWGGFGGAKEPARTFQANSKTFSRVFLLFNGKCLEGEKQLMLHLLDMFLFVQVSAGCSECFNSWDTVAKQSFLKCST